MDRPEPTALRREVERPGTGGHGLAPMLVLGAAMASTVLVAALAMAVPYRSHCARAVRTDDAFARPRAPAAVTEPTTVTPSGATPAAASPCAPRVYRAGTVQEWTFETCASAPMPRNFIPGR